MTKPTRSFLLDVVVPMTVETMDVVHKYLLKPHLHKICPHVWTRWENKVYGCGWVRERKCTLCGKEERM